MYQAIITYDKSSEFQFFWNGPFSNFYKCDLIIDKINFNCTEQYYMAQKALFFKDHASYEKIMKAPHPIEQKQLGRSILNFNADEWNAVSKNIMFKANMQKYIQNPILGELLINTFPKILVEASPYDLIWGIGLTEERASKTNYEQWIGKNWLGFVLTNIRVCLMNNNLILTGLNKVE